MKFLRDLLYNFRVIASDCLLVSKSRTVFTGILEIPGELLISRVDKSFKMSLESVWLNSNLAPIIPNLLLRKCLKINCLHSSIVLSVDEFKLEKKLNY